MLELPGLNSSGDLKKDLDGVRRYLGRLVPQLERALEDLGVDGFAEQMAIREQGLEGASTGTTAGALADHVLDKNNPHQVTLDQLEPVTFWQTEDGWAVIICGVAIECRWKSLEAATGTAAGSCWRRDVNLGDWGLPFTALWHTWAKVKADSLADIWAGCTAGADEANAGSVRIFSADESMPACAAVIYGIGGISNG